MHSPDEAAWVEEQIVLWRSYLRRRQAIQSVDVAELEDHLREHLRVLASVGLRPDEAFLVAVKRIGNLDALSREFAREHSDRLWKQLVILGSDSGEPRGQGRTDAIVAFWLAVAAGVMIKLPALFGISMKQEGGFYPRNLGLLVLPLLTCYFVWKRRLDTRAITGFVVAFVVAGLFVNLPGFAVGGATEALAALHLPMALWLVVGMAYAGCRWGQVGGRMDFIRFSGEFFIYYVLIALGGGVLTAFMATIFKAIGIKLEVFFEGWLLPCGAAGAVVIAAWLAEAKQSVIENMAPVLTRLFTPLFTAVLLTFLVTLLWTGRGISTERHVIIAFDVLLMLVLGLLVYSVSARDPRSPPGGFDVLQVVLVVSALVADAVALWAIGARITEFGFTPNRVAALGENLILLINLTWSTLLYIRFLRGSGSFASLETWQTDYLPIYGIWAAIVVIIFPPLFGYV